MWSTDVHATVLQTKVCLPAGGQAAQPVGSAVLQPGRYSWIWVVVDCPYCGGSHHHYGGSLIGNPYHYVGQVVPARCDYAADQHGAHDEGGTPGTYVLMAVSPSGHPRLLAAATASTATGQATLPPLLS